MKKDLPIKYADLLSDMTQYIIPTGKKRPVVAGTNPWLSGIISPFSMKSVGPRLDFTFMLNENYAWSELLKAEPHSTHKILGMGDAANQEKVCLGIKSGVLHGVECFRAVNYIHRNGKFEVQVLPNLAIVPGVVYQCTIVDHNDYVRMEIIPIHKIEMSELWYPEPSIIKSTIITVEDPLGRWLYGPYFEVGSKAFTIDLPLSICIYER